MEAIEIRKGEEKDVKSLLGLITELAIYENAPNEVEVTEDILMQDGFGPNSIFEFYVASINEQIVGIALYYIKYSTWKGKCVYLEDIVVSELHRRKGIGKLLFDSVKQVAVEKKVKRLEWQVLNWNSPAIAFYKSLDAQFDDEWINVKLSGNQLCS